MIATVRKSATSAKSTKSAKSAKSAEGGGFVPEKNLMSILNHKSKTELMMH